MYKYYSIYFACCFFLIISCHSKDERRLFENRVDTKTLDSLFNNSSDSLLYRNVWIYLGQPRDSLITKFSSEFRLVDYSVNDIIISPIKNGDLDYSNAVGVGIRNGKVSYLDRDIKSIYDKNGTAYALELISALSKYKGKQQVYIEEDIEAPRYVNDQILGSRFVSGRSIILYFGHKYIKIRFSSDNTGFSSAEIREGMADTLLTPQQRP
jgi:hypothetical protein